MCSSRLSGHMLSFDFEKNLMFSAQLLTVVSSQEFIYVDNQVPPRTKLVNDDMMKKVLTFQRNQSIDFQYHRTMHFIFLTMTTVKKGRLQKLVL